MSTDIKRVKAASTMVDLVAKSKGTAIAPREILDKIERLAPEAVNTLQDLMMNSKADSVKLKAALEILGIAGVSREMKVSIRADVTDMSNDELDDKLRALLGRETIEGAAETVLDRHEEIH
jgi:hypothetical protein